MDPYGTENPRQSQSNNNQRIWDWTSVVFSRDHKSMFVGDAKGRVYSWSVADEPGRGAANHWVKDEGGDGCTACGAKFSFAERRHHCRNCGQLFCSKWRVNWMLTYVYMLHPFLSLSHPPPLALDPLSAALTSTTLHVYTVDTIRSTGNERVKCLICVSLSWYLGSVQCFTTAAVWFLWFFVVFSLDFSYWTSTIKSVLRWGFFASLRRYFGIFWKLS